jgi:hypothetical protein
MLTADHRSLRFQANRRFGLRLQFGTHCTWSKLITFSHNQYLPELTKNLVIGTNC